MPKICEGEECEKQSSYGLPGGRPRWCLEHAPGGSENVNRRRCAGGGQGERCQSKPTFAMPPRRRGRGRGRGRGRARSGSSDLGGVPPKWCSEHAPGGAVDVSRGGRCPGRGAGEPCDEMPMYALRPGDLPTWCPSHRPKNSSTVFVADKRCMHSGCYRVARVGGERAMPLWCKDHAPKKAAATARLGPILPSRVIRPNVDLDPL